MKILNHILAYVLALCGGLIVLFVATSVPALLGLGWPRGALIALPFAFASSILPYVAALAFLNRRERRSLNLHLLAGSLVAMASVGLLALALGLDAALIFSSSRTFIGILLAGAVGAYIQDQVRGAFISLDGGTRA